MLYLGSAGASPPEGQPKTYDNMSDGCIQVSGSWYCACWHVGEDLLLLSRKDEMAVMYVEIFRTLHFLLNVFVKV